MQGIDHEVRRRTATRTSAGPDNLTLACADAPVSPDLTYLDCPVQQIISEAARATLDSRSLVLPSLDSVEF